MKRLTHKEVSRRGGLTTSKKYGKSLYTRMGKNGVKGKLKKYGPDYFKNLAKKGLEARKMKIVRERLEAGKNALDNDTGSIVK